MPKERTTSTASEVKGQLEKIERSLSRVDSICQNIGEILAAKRLKGIPQGDFFDVAIELGQTIAEVKTRLEQRAIPTLIAQRESLQQDLDAVRLTVAEKNLVKIQEATRTGLIPSDVLGEARKRLASLRAEFGLSLASMSINLNNREVAIDGQRQKIYSTSEWETLVFLARRAVQDVSGEELDLIAVKDGYSAKNPSRYVISGLRKLFEADPKNPKVITQSGRQAASRSYRLNAEVEFIGQEEQKTALSSSIVMMELFLDNPSISFDELSQKLAETRALSKQKIIRALGTTANNLYARINQNQATTQEVELWQRIRFLVGTREDKEALRKFRGMVRDWNQRQRQPEEAVVAPVETVQPKVITTLVPETAETTGGILSNLRRFLRKRTDK